MENEIATLQTQKRLIGDGEISAGDDKGGRLLINLDLTRGKVSVVDNITKEQIGLENVDNTSDENKPVSAIQKNYIDNRFENVLNQAKEYTDDKTAAIDSIAWDVITDKPSTIDGYGITDSVPTRFIDDKFEYFNGSEWIEITAEAGGSAPGSVNVLTFMFSETFVPADYNLQNKYVSVYLVGGGGGGGSGSSAGGGGGGGGGGYCRFESNILLEEESYNIIIGAGGIGGATLNGLPGGNTSAFGIVAPGGQPGTIGTIYGGNGGAGGSGGGAGEGTMAATSPGGFGGSGGTDGESVNTTTSKGGIGGGNINYTPINPITGIAYGCGGGGGGNGAGGTSATPTNGGSGGGTGGTGGVAGFGVVGEPGSHGKGFGGGGGGGGGSNIAGKSNNGPGGIGAIGGGGGGGSAGSYSTTVIGPGGCGGAGIVYIYY